MTTPHQNSGACYSPMSLIDVARFLRAFDASATPLSAAASQDVSCNASTIANA